MALTLDTLYLENLDEYIFDDQKFVSYKWLACKLGVHVNLAKQMLYQFLETRKAAGKKIYTMYYLSGLAPQKWIAKIDMNEEGPPPSSPENSAGEDDEPRPYKGSPDMFPSDSDEDEDDDEQSSCYSDDAFLVMICRDDELEAYRKQFSDIFSLHIYGLSAFPMTRKKLDEFTAVSIYDDAGNPPQRYGAMTCKAAHEFRVNPRTAQMLQNIAEVKAKVAIDKEKWEKEEAIKAKEKLEREKELSSKMKNVEIGESSKAKKTGGGGKDRLKNMFAAVASKPKKVVEEPPPKKKDRPSVDKRGAEKTTASSSSKSWNNKQKETVVAKNKKKDKGHESPKRKRIRRDVFSSSDDSEDENDKNDKQMSDDEEEDSESPIPRSRKHQIQSDSEDDDFQVQPKKSRHSSSETGKPVEKSATSGKKRVSKIVPERYEDEDGFLVTVMKQTMVSESDTSEGEELAKRDDSPIEIVQKNFPKKPSTAAAATTASSSSSFKPKGNIPPPKTTKQSSKSVPAGKSKQASIMSFFKKE